MTVDTFITEYELVEPKMLDISLYEGLGVVTQSLNRNKIVVTRYGADIFYRSVIVKRVSQYHYMICTVIDGRRSGWKDIILDFDGGGGGGCMPPHRCDPPHKGCATHFREYVRSEVMRELAELN